MRGDSPARVKESRVLWQASPGRRRAVTPRKEAASMRRCGRVFVVCVLLPVLLSFAAGPVLAQEVIAGFDLLKTQPGTPQEDLSGLSGLCAGVQVVGNSLISLRGIPL